MQEEPAALFLRVLVIDESPRVVGTRFVSATPAWSSISKGCCDSAFCSHMEFPASQRTLETCHYGECSLSTVKLLRALVALGLGTICIASYN